MFNIIFKYLFYNKIYFKNFITFIFFINNKGIDNKLKYEKDNNILVTIIFITLKISYYKSNNIIIFWMI